MPIVARFLMLLVVLTLTPLAAQTPDFTPVTTRVQNLVTSAHLPGAAVLIVRNGEPIYQQAFGNYTLQQRVPVASATKWLSAAVIARLVDRDDQVHRRNIHYTVVDGVMFPPAMLTLDLRDQAAKEMNTVEARNKRLIELADMKGC